MSYKPGGIAPDELPRVMKFYETIQATTAPGSSLGRIPRTYAEALLAVADERQCVDQLAADFHDLGHVVFPALPNLEPGYGELAPPGAAMAVGAEPGHVNGSDEVEPGWTQVYQDFVRIKQDCGEAVDGFTFERFSQTLRKNRDQLLQRHACKSVKFSVYIKEGKAALKASPIRE